MSYPWEVQAETDEEGYAPTIGFVWTETPDRADALELARVYYGSRVRRVVKSRYGAQTPPTGYVAPTKSTST